MIAKTKKQLQDTKEYFLKELNKLQGNRVNPQIIEDIKIDAYNTKMPINQLATVTVVDPTLISIQCWDKNNVEKVEKAIQESELNVNPSVEGSLVRVPIPSLTEERRKELVKYVKQLSEDVKISARNIRRDNLQELEKSAPNEDEYERGKKEIQELVDGFNEFVVKELESKENELLTV